MPLDKIVKSWTVTKDCLKRRLVEVRDVHRERVNLHRLRVGLGGSGTPWHLQVSQLR